MESKKRIRTWLIIGTIEILVFWLFIYSAKPTPGVSIALVIFIPFILGINILTGLILYFVKKRQAARMAFINSFVGSVIFILLWELWFAGWEEKNYLVYSFEIEKTKFEVSLSKTSDFFSISDVTNQSHGSTTGLFFGEYRTRGDTIILVDNETKMKIINNKLVGFPQAPTEIELSKITGR